jgi:hypothetical protein
MPRTAYQRINPAAPRAIKPVLVDDPNIKQISARRIRERQGRSVWRQPLDHSSLGAVAEISPHPGQSHGRWGARSKMSPMVEVARSKKAGVKVLGFEKDEPATILQAARQTNNTLA